MGSLEGRTRELAWLGERIAGLREGRAFAALVRGEPGVGKSTLIASALARDADGVRVLHARGYESDSEIPFAGLLELATPLLSLRAELPEAQRAALESAFALEAPEAHDRFAVPAGLLSLLARARADDPATPLLAVVDDVHWLDDASRDALLFVARRLAVDGVGLLLAARAGEAAGLDLAGVEELALAGLDASSARALLERGAPGLAGPVADTLVAATAGNPLALVELPDALSPGQLSGDEPLADPLPASAAVEHAFAHQLARLPDPTRRALVLAAALHRGQVDVLTAALRRLELADDVLAPAERARVVTVRRDELTFRHPLLRAAVYQAAASSERRAAHAALGAVAPDARVRAWHLAHAAATADEEVAAGLEAAAYDARARSGHAEAARAFARAAELSTDRSAQGRRALEAAQDHAVAGHLGPAQSQLEIAVRHADPALASAIVRLRGHLAIRRGEPGEAQEILEGAAAEAVAAGDHATAAMLLLESSISYTATGSSEGMRSVLERASAAAAVAGGVPELLARTMVAVEQTVTGETAQASAELHALEPLLAELDPVGLGEPVGLLALALLWSGDDVASERVIGRLVTALRERGAIGALPVPLMARALMQDRRGNWAEALADAQDAVRLTREIGQASFHCYCLAGLARIEAGLGRTDEARARAREGLTLVDAAHAVYAVYHLAAIGRAELADERLEDAAVALGEVHARSVAMGWHEQRITLHAGDHVEVLVRLGRIEEAEALLERLAADAELTGGAWTHAIVERGRMLLAEPDDLDAHATLALEWHARDGMPFERARTELAYGERLRRRRRRMDARGPLERALETFRALGAAPWARRTAQELDAAGGAREAAAGNGAPTRDALSPHELKIALMVAHGMTNREVAQTLFLSPKTIERHLSRIYRTLEVRSRTELARLLAEGGGG